MFYLIYGLENYLINENINKIIDELKINSEEIIKMDMSSSTINSLLVEASSVNMFSNRKLILCDNSSFLSSKDDINSKEDIEELIKYLDKPFEDVYLVFILREETIDSRKKISKLISSISKVYVCNKIENYNLNNYLMDYIRNKGYTISSRNIELLISKTSYELSVIMKELDKLFIYKNKDKKITEEDIENVITNNIETNIFDLTNAIINKEKSKIDKLYKELIRRKEDPLKLIITLSNQFRLYLQVKIMRNNGFSEKEIVSTLKEHPYRISLALKNDYSIEELKDNLEKLSKLDLDIVSGKVDKEFGFEMYLLNI